MFLDGRNHQLISLVFPVRNGPELVQNRVQNEFLGQASRQGRSALADPLLVFRATHVLGIASACVKESTANPTFNQARQHVSAVTAPRTATQFAFVLAARRNARDIFIQNDLGRIKLLIGDEPKMWQVSRPTFEFPQAGEASELPCRPQDDDRSN